MKYLLFDLDGTLTESGIGIVRCVRHALEHFGIEEKSDEKLKQFIGPPLYDSFVTVYGMSHDDALKAVDVYRERYRDIGIFENAPYPGIIKVLTELKNHGYIMAVASSKPEIFVNRILEHFSLSSFFTVVTGATMDGSIGAKKDVIKLCLDRLSGCDIKEDSLMIGDKSHDVIGAHENSLKCIGCLWGYGSRKELEDCNCDYIVSSITELYTTLMNL
ncbi:MAG: HAD hydrolase-like protein [Succinivibrio sp.]